MLKNSIKNFFKDLLRNTAREREDKFAYKVIESIAIGNTIEAIRFMPGCVLLKMNTGNCYIFQPCGMKKNGETKWINEATEEEK